MSAIIIEEKISELFKDANNFFLVDDKLDFDFPKKNLLKISVNNNIKSLSFFEKTLNSLIQNKLHRNSHLVVIGGGTLSDFGGFLASTLFRGISWSVVPTTLLAQVDAAIGGKTGVNFGNVKNLIGAFHLPERIYINHFWLETLPDKEKMSGLGEIFKYAFLDKNIFKFTIGNEPLTKIIQKCAEYKKQLVEQDFKEKNKRIILNLGHTVGHGIEMVTDYPHGICVVLGIKTILNCYQKDLLDDFNSLLAKLKLDLTKYPLPEFSLVSDPIKLDKKRISADKIQILIPSEIGKIDIQVKEMDFFLNELKETW